MDRWSRDLRHALRRLRRAPAFTLLAVIIMGLGIGANTTMFGLVEALLLRPLPHYEDPELVWVYTTEPRSERPERVLPEAVSYQEFLDYRAASGVFSETALHRDGYFFTLSVGESRLSVLGEALTAGFLPMLGIRPVLGRGFDPSEDRPGSPPVVILGNGTWQRRFGGDPEIVGQVIGLNGHPVTVVGVAPPEFTGDTVGFEVEVFVPLGTAAAVGLPDLYEDRNDRDFFMLARLAPGVGLEQAESAMKSVAVHMSEAYPATNHERDAQVYFANEVRLHPAVDVALVPVALFLMAIVGLVLFVACANLANLVLVRTTSRGREIALRRALGASRKRLMAELLSESAVLGLLGGTFGVLLSLFAIRLIPTMEPPIPVPMALDVRLNTVVLGFTAALSIATGILSGLAPALRASGRELADSLKKDSLDFGGRFRMRDLLVVGQVAVSTLLLLGGGLYVRSTLQTQKADLGFDREHGVVMNLDVAHAGIDDAASAQALFDRIGSRLEGLRDVESVTVASRLPMGMFGTSRRRVYRTDLEYASDEETETVEAAAVGASYFETLGVPLLRGRGFYRADGGAERPVAVVNEALALELWGNLEVVGRPIGIGSLGSGDSALVIGVARDTIVRELGEEPTPMLYRPLTQDYQSWVSVVAGTSTNPGSRLEEFRREVESLDSRLALLEVTTLEGQRSMALWIPRTVAGLLALLGAIAMLLAGVGLYGVVAFSVARRTHEVGLRLALGADRAQVVWMVIRQGVARVGIGLVAGAGTVALLSRPIGRTLVGISAFDPLTFAAVGLLLLMTAGLASGVPALRASRIDPVDALRSE